MKCVLKVDKLKKNASYYCSDKDFDKKVGGEFQVLIQPFEGENELFYYMEELKNGEILLEGEGYIITDNDVLNRYKKEARASLAYYKTLNYDLKYYDAKGLMH